MSHPVSGYYTDGEAIVLGHANTARIARCAELVAEGNFADARWVLAVLNSFGHMVEHMGDTRREALLAKPPEAGAGWTRVAPGLEDAA